MHVYSGNPTTDDSDYFKIPNNKPQKIQRKTYKLTNKNMYVGRVFIHCILGTVSEFMHKVKPEHESISNFSQQTANSTSKKSSSKHIHV